MKEQFLMPGTVVGGRFRVEDMLGAGASSAVYRGVQEGMGREVAIKVLNLDPRSRTSDEVRKRFEREAQVAAQLSHPSIVAVYDHGVLDDGVPYIVMELIEGDNLDSYIQKRGPLGLHRACTLVVKTLDALHMAHDLDVIHRDLKPQNLLFKDAGRKAERLCILDFGMAFLAEATAARLTQQGQINGTPSYLAPEYIVSQVLTPALDVYQMGLILAEMVAGEPAVRARSPMEALKMHVHGKLTLPEALVDSAAGPVMQKALAKQYSERFAHAGEFRDALRSALKKIPKDSSSETTVTVDPPRPSGSLLSEEVRASGQHAALALQATRRAVASSASGEREPPPRRSPARSDASSSGSRAQPNDLAGRSGERARPSARPSTGHRRPPVQHPPTYTYPPSVHPAPHRADRTSQIIVWITFVLLVIALAAAVIFIFYTR